MKNRFMPGSQAVTRACTMTVWPTSGEMSSAPWMALIRVASFTPVMLKLTLAVVPSSAVTVKVSVCTAPASRNCTALLSTA